MPRTPFFGPFDVTRSTNFADNECINLRPEFTDVQAASRGVGALYGTPGLLLLNTVGAGPINGERPLGSSVLYVVSNLYVYTIGTANWLATLVDGPLTSAFGVARVGMTDNGTQILIATDTHVYVGPVGHPLQGGNGVNPGTNYAVDDLIVLAISGAGTATASAILRVDSVGGGGNVTGFTIVQTGAYNPTPTLLVQSFTTGSGSGFQLDTLVFGTSQVLCDIYLPFTPASSQFPMYPTFQDGFCFLNQRGTQVMWQSLVLDISVWPPLNFAMADGESDNIQVMASIHRQLVVIKDRSTEFWNNAGTSGFAFQPLNGTMVEAGTGAPASVCKVGESLIWVNRSSQGEGTVIQNDGYQTRRVSTYAVENILNNHLDLDQSYAYSYQQEGHQYYVLTFPDAGITLVYDKTGSQQSGIPIWYQWLYYNNGTGDFEQHRGNAYAFFNSTCVLGDYANGNIYAIRLDTLDDFGNPRKWQRSWRALPQPVYSPVRFASLQLDMMTGEDVAIGTHPTVELQWSDDGGHTFTNPISVSAGDNGQTAKRVFWTRLGSTRRNSGLDRIFRVSSVGEYSVCLINAELDLQ